MHSSLIQPPPTKTSTPTSAIRHQPMPTIGLSNENSCFFMGPYLLRIASYFYARCSPIFPEACVGQPPLPDHCRTRRRWQRGFGRRIRGRSFGIQSGAQYRSWYGFRFQFSFFVFLLLLLLILILLSFATNQRSHRLQGRRILVGTGTGELRRG